MFLPLSLSSSSSEKLAPLHRPRVVLRTLGSFDFRCVGMAAASHDIRLRGSTLVLLNVPRRKDSEGEPLIVWFDRIRLPHEFRDVVDHIRDPIDIEEFVFSERQIADTSPKGLKSAHYLYGYFLQVGLATGTPDTKRAPWHPAEMANTGGQPRTRRSG